MDGHILVLRDVLVMFFDVSRSSICYSLKHTASRGEEDSRGEGASERGCGTKASECDGFPDASCLSTVPALCCGPLKQSRKVRGEEGVSEETQVSTEADQRGKNKHKGGRLRSFNVLRQNNSISSNGVPAGLNRRTTGVLLKTETVWIQVVSLKRDWMTFYNYNSC